MSRQYIISERAHLMCPNMQFGICAKINAPFDEGKINSALNELQGAHPFLKSVIAAEEDTKRLFYDVRQTLELKCAIKSDFSHFSEDYSALVSQGWNVFEEGLLKVVAYPCEGNFQILFFCHHLLCDGRGLLGLAAEFADLYVGGKKPAAAPERLMQSKADLPQKGELSLINRLIINGANRRWKKESRAVSYDEYLLFEREFIKANPVTIETETKNSEEIAQIVKICKENEVSVNDWLIAKMMLEEGAKRVVIAADIRKKLSCYNSGALGNYATAAGIESGGRTGDLMTMAKAESKQVSKKLSDDKGLMLILACYFAMEPQLIDAAAISVLGDFESKAGKFIGSAILGYDKRAGYSITNLGKIESESMSEAMFIPPASPANKKTVGVLTVNGAMKICTACSGRRNA